MNHKINDSQINDPILITDGYMIKNSGYEMQLNDVTKLSSAHTLRGKRVALGTDTSVVTFVRDFTQMYPNIKNIQPDILYAAVIKDISVLPQVKDLVKPLSDAYDAKFNTNINALYTHAPISFDMLMENSTLYEYYQKMFFVYIMMQYIIEHREELTAIPNIAKYITWIQPHNDPNAGYFIEGPKENSDFKVDDIVERYRSLIDPSTSKTDITSYHQLATAQQMSATQQDILTFLSNNPNVFLKTPNELSKYLLSIDSSNKVLVTIDEKNNNLIFDCSNLTVGDLAEGGNTARLHEIKLDPSPRSEVAKEPIRSIRDLFSSYGRIKIINLTFTKNTFITSLTAFEKVFVAFEGVSCDERALYNTAMAPFLIIGGKFTTNAKGDYEFIPDQNAMTYKPSRVAVDSFKIYVTTNPTGKNKINPNQYTLKVNTSNIYQHPYKTNLKPNEAPTVRLDNYTYYDSTTEESRKNVETAYYLNEANQLKAEAFNVLAANTFTLPADHQFTKGMLKKLIVHFNSMLGYLAEIFDRVHHTPFTNYVKNSINNYLTSLADKCNNILQRSAVTIEELQYLRALFNGYTQTDAKQLINTIISGFNVVYDFEHISKNPTANTSSFIAFDEPNNVYYVPILRNSISSTYQTALLTAIQQHINNLVDISDKDVQTIFNDCSMIIRHIPLENMPIIDFITHLNCVFTMYAHMAKLFYYDIEKASLNTHISQRIVTINTQNGTIENKFFRMINGKPVFVDEHGEPFATPDPEYLEFSEEQNDLLLYNLFKYSRGNIEVIPNSSYRYSSIESTIERIPYTLLDCSKIFGSLRFNNNYQLNDLTILPKFKDANAANNEIHWDQLELLWKNDIFIYYKTVTTSLQLGTTTAYTAVNVKNNALVDAIAADKIIATYNFDNNIWIDTLETDNRYIDKTGVFITIEQLFNYNTANYDTSIVAPVLYAPYNVQVIRVISTEAATEQGVQQVASAILNGLSTKKMYNKYYDKATNMVYDSEYFSITTEINDTEQMNYTLSRNVNYLMSFDSSSPLNTQFSTELLKYFNEVTVTGLFNNYEGLASDIYFKGFVKRQLANSNIYFLTGIIGIKDTNQTYLVSLTGSAGSGQYQHMLYFNANNKTELIETAKHPHAQIVYKDYFSNEMVISNSTFSFSLADSFDELHGKTMKVQDSNSITIMVTYTVKRYSTCTEVTIDTAVKSAITAATDFTHYYTYVDIVNGSNIVISTREPTNTYSSPDPLVVVNELGIFCDERATYQQELYSATINEDMSNAYKAFKIDGYSVISKYWNNDIYDYSILHALVPFKPSLVAIPARVELEYANDKNTDVYAFDEKSRAITKLAGTYTVTPTEIKYSTDAKVVKSFYVYKHEQKAYSYVQDPDNYIFSTSPITVTLVDANDMESLRLNINFNNMMTTITSIEILGKNRYYNKLDKPSVYYSESLPLGTYTNTIVSGVPFYIESNHARFKAIIEFNINEAAMNVEFDNISITETIDELIYYEVTPTGPMQCIMPHVYNNNIPGDAITATDEIMNLQMTYEQYRYHPCYAYIENSFAESKYVNTNEDLITMLNVYNQNTQVMDANIKNENTLSNADAYKVGNFFACDNVYVVESLDDNMLMISDFDKRNVLNDIAIQKDQIYVIPKTTRMTLSLEFS